MIDTLIVDDRDIIRDSMKLVFSESKSISLKDEAEDGLEAMELIIKKNFDVVLMDINMPNMNGVEATEQIKKINSNIKVLAHSFHVNPFFIKKMIAAGASGFIKKGEGLVSYTEAIETVHKGKIFLSDKVSTKIYNKVFSYLNYSSGKMITSS